MKDHDAPRVWPGMLLLLVTALAHAAPTPAQSVLDRPPNLSGGWVVPSGIVQFNFVHRFQQSGPPERDVSSSPSFLLAAGLPAGWMIGAKYATASGIAPRYPNEWEFFGRLAALSEEDGALLDLAGELAYNLAAESVDGELSVARGWGPLRVIGAARAFSNAFNEGEARFALAGGATARIWGDVAIGGDVAALSDRDPGEELAWGAGLQFPIPYTPHTLSLHATNTNTAILQGSSLGGDVVRYGFEFTIPVTLSRYFRRSTASGPPANRPAGPTVGETIDIAIEDFAYSIQRLEVPVGTTIVWTNTGQVMHTVTARGGSWDSGDLEPGARWAMTFDEPGDYDYFCRPHPFMTAAISVKPRREP